MLAIFHREKVRKECVQIGALKMRMRGHIAVAEAQRIDDVAANLIDRSILHDALGHIQIGTDATAFAIDGVTANALLGKQSEAAIHHGILGIGKDVWEQLLKARKLNRHQLPWTRIRFEVLLMRLGPKQIKRSRVGALWTDRLPRGGIGLCQREISTFFKEHFAANRNGVAIATAQDNVLIRQALAGESLRQKLRERNREKGLFLSVVRIKRRDACRR